MMVATTELQPMQQRRRVWPVWPRPEFLPQSVCVDLGCRLFLPPFTSSCILCPVPLACGLWTSSQMLTASWLPHWFWYQKIWLVLWAELPPWNGDSCGCLGVLSWDHEVKTILIKALRPDLPFPLSWVHKAFLRGYLMCGNRTDECRADERNQPSLSPPGLKEVCEGGR